MEIEKYARRSYPIQSRHLLVLGDGDPWVKNIADLAAYILYKE